MTPNRRVDQVPVWEDIPDLGVAVAGADSD